MGDRVKILWVDEEPMQIAEPLHFLQDCGFEVDLAETATECLAKLKETQFQLVILDVMMRHGDELPTEETKGGTETGVSLARRVQKADPKALVIGCSIHRAQHVRDWFRRFANGFIAKEDLYPLHSLENQVRTLFKLERMPPKAFIVHGHAEKEVMELKNYLQNTLGFPQPTILHEKPNLGRTIIEKFEDESRDIEIVFVLLTPDDTVAAADDTEEIKRRARQNVIFELGFFLAKLERRSGRVILLHKGGLELPSDIAGIVYIDVTPGIEEAGEKIRKELVGLV